jgi:integrase
MSDTRNLKKRNRIWWFVKQKAGQTIERSLDTEDLGVAQTRRDRLTQELIETDGLKWGERRKRTFAAVAELFAQKHFERIRPSSAQRYFASLKQLIPHFGAIQIDEIRSSHLAAFEDKRRAEGVVGASIRRDLACMSVMYSYAESWEWVARNPVKPYLFLRKRAGLKDSEPRERFLSHAEEDVIIARIAPKARDALIFAVDTGLRKNEQFSQLWPDVDLRARELLVRKEVAKNGKERTVPILKRTHQLLARMWDERDVRCPYVFATGQGKRYSLARPCRRPANVPASSSTSNGTTCAARAAVGCCRTGASASRSCRNG